jgi:hypothetical protein
MTDLSKPILIDGITDTVVVFFQDDGVPDNRMRWSGDAYLVMPHGDGGWSFYSDKTYEIEEDREKARYWFQFSFVWRGVWEGRVYPKQSEFMGEDLAELAEMWNKIEKILKDVIKQDNPDYGCFDE